MKVVQIYKDYYPPSVGGIEQTVERMAAHLVRNGAQVTVLTSHPGSRRTVEETVKGVRVIRCGEWARALSTPLCPDMPRQLAKLEADLYHLHYPSPPGEVSWLSARPKGAMVMTWHGDVIRQRAVMPVYGHVVHAVVRRADAVMPTFEGQAERSKILPHYKSKLRVVPLGIDLAPFERRPEHAAVAAELRQRYGTPLVLFVGRLVDFKGVDVLLDAMPSVAGRLLVVGAGPEKARLEAKALAMRLGERVAFAGRVEPSQIVNYLEAADVGVLPSKIWQEAFGLSMVEMMAHGLPVVCTELGTGTSFVNRHGESGLVVAPRDPAALAAAINQLLSDEVLRRRLGQGASARAHQLFTTEAMMRGVMDVYAEALARRRAA